MTIPRSTFNVATSRPATTRRAGGLGPSALGVRAAIGVRPPLPGSPEARTRAGTFRGGIRTRNASGSSFEPDAPAKEASSTGRTRSNNGIDLKSELEARDPLAVAWEKELLKRGLSNKQAAKSTLLEHALLRALVDRRNVHLNDRQLYQMEAALIYLSESPLGDMERLKALQPTFQKALREGNITLQQVAEDTGAPMDQLRAYYKNGRANWDDETIDRLADILKQIEE